MSRKQPSFEEAYRELETVVKKLEDGGLALEESLSLFQRGMELVQYLSKLLDEAELKVKSLAPQPGGGFEVEDYPQEEE